MNILASETWVNRTAGYIVGESGIYETFTNDIGKLFKSYQREYGRCVSKVYVDLEDSKARAIGWVFEKNVRYTDTKEVYKQETWITLHEAKPDIVKTFHYKDLEA